MSVKIDPSGRRWVQAEVEVPGTPEQVWQAIATGPGISSWFVPTDLEERAGGVTVSHFGPGMDSAATITAWEPPHRFAAEGGDLGSPSPPLATEWIVEARSGGHAGRLRLGRQGPRVGQFLPLRRPRPGCLGA